MNKDSLNFASILGVGSVGFVLKSKNSDGSFSAVKIMFKGSVENDKNLARECSLLMGKEHKNIVKIQNVFSHPFTISDIENLLVIAGENNEELEDQLTLRKIKAQRSKQPIPSVCIQMELCGKTVRDWLNNRQRTDRVELKLEQLSIICDTICGVKFLHNNKILHRDLKPENIMFALNSKSVKIGDFGISRNLNNSINTNMLTKNVGTRNYMAPEMDTGDYDFRSDLYSLGLVIWEVAQLIPFKERARLFQMLVYSENENVVNIDLTPNIGKMVIGMTKLNRIHRPNDILELDELINEMKICESDLKSPISPVPLRFVSFLGQGSFGIALKIKNNDQSFSALKIIFNQDNEDKYNLRECTILKGKQHKNIICIENAFESIFSMNEIDELINLIDDEDVKDRLWFIKYRIRRSRLPVSAICIQMELCGDTLRSWLNSVNPLQQKNLEKKQLKIIQGIIDGLKFLHANKILHRNIKPENIMFSLDNESIKIGDFGVSRILHSETTRTNSLTCDVGTLDYRAPEMNSSVYDFRSDLFSLGLVIWEVAQLIPPENRRIMFHKLVHNHNIDVVTTKLTPKIAQTIINLTKRRVDERIQSIHDLDQLIFSKPIAIIKPLINFYTAKNSEELTNHLTLGKSHITINLLGTNYTGHFHIKNDGIKIVGKSENNTKITGLKKSGVPIFTIDGNDCCIMQLIIEIDIDGNGIDIRGSKNTIENVDINGGFQSLEIRGEFNKINSIRAQNSQKGIILSGNGHKIQNISLQNISLIGILIDSSNTEIKKIKCENVVSGIHIRGRTNLVDTIKYFKSVNKPNFIGVIIEGKNNAVINLTCKWESKHFSDWGFQFLNSEQCSLTNSEGGPGLLNGVENNLQNVECCESLKILSPRHKINSCSGDKLIGKQYFDFLNGKSNNFAHFLNDQNYNENCII